MGREEIVNKLCSLKLCVLKHERASPSSAPTTKLSFDMKILPTNLPLIMCEACFAEAHVVKILSHTRQSGALRRVKIGEINPISLLEDLIST